MSNMEYANSRVRTRLLFIITTWPFLLSLTVLLLNDLWLKSAFPGAITGKLSDFAGIAVVTFLLLAAFPRNGLIVYFVISLAFLWWKSPVSEPFIRLFNNLKLFDIGRTVDYSDMIALLVFPVCHVVSYQNYEYATRWPRIRRIMVAPTIAATIAALLGTSSIPTRQEYAVRTISAAEELRYDEIADVVEFVAANHGLVKDRRPDPQYAMTFSGNSITMSYSFSGKNVISFSIKAYSDGLIFGTRGADKANAIRNDIKKNLASRFQDLEYVEPLALH
jgi:hypothetical protein